MAAPALQDVSLRIEDGSYTAIIGHTGSGKSTLLQHFNGLLKPTSGQLTVNGVTITPATKNKELSDLRHQVGFVFQFPEAQLFEETVLKDIAFAPRNFGKSSAEAEQIARKVAAMVGLSETTLTQSPFDLSGGQMRRAAIAGILAMEPHTLILDEPTAGLDPQGRRSMMNLFARLHREYRLTIILVTHQMDDVADYADHVIVMEHGQVLQTGTPRQVFADAKWLREHHLRLPQTAAMAEQLAARGFSFDPLPLTEHELADQLVPQLQGGGRHD